MSAESGSKWSKPKVNLAALIFPQVMTGETAQRLHSEYSSSPKLMWEKICSGIYTETIYAETEYHDKSAWLSNKGQLLEQQLKLLFQKLASEASQKVINVM